MRRDKKEIRNLLLGKMVLDEDGKLVTPPAGAFRVPRGVTDGAGSVRLFGITGKARRYETDLSGEAVMEAPAEEREDGMEVPQGSDREDGEDWEESEEAWDEPAEETDTTGSEEPAASEEEDTEA